jgi:acetylornithine deacetylase/succinyl-diaminopimelate desuccinylase-like protein
MPGVTGAGTAAAKLAQRLVRIPSPSGQEGAAVELLAEAMSAHGFDVRVDRAGNAIGSLGRGLPGHPHLLIDGHVDTIPLPREGLWSRDPLGGEIHAGRLYGLGACDQKASIAAAIEGLARCPRCSAPRPAACHSWPE